MSLRVAGSSVALAVSAVQHRKWPTIALNLPSFQQVLEHHPITLGLCLMMATIHGVVHLGPNRDSIVLRFAFNTDFVVKHRQWHRLVTSAFLHADASHILHNMCSFLLVGPSLERRLGKAKFALTVTAATLASSLIKVILKSIQTRLRHDVSTTNTTKLALGFSGVLYHLDVVHYATRKMPTLQIVGEIGFMLFLDQGPGVSFIGHLSGALSGALQVVAMKLWKYQDP